MRKPTADLITYANLWDNLWKDDYVEGHQAMAQFIREQVPLPGALLRQIVDKLIRGNELAGGATELSGRTVELRDVRCPLLVVMAERDELVPIDSTLILREFMGPNMEELLLPAGHVGLITGRKAATVTIPHIIDWIAEHSQSLQTTEVPR
jgi:polyhydroxyalkanoate synthase